MLADSSSQDVASACPPAPPMLPPCRICGEKASGFHYGANTCEACKGFFRRSLARKEVYKCAADGRCEIEPGKRNACAACRYKKCIAIGMSKTAIKTGRYTHEKKTKDIEEVKRLQLQKRLKQEGKIVMTVEEREKELDKIIKHITAVHLQQTPHTQEFFDNLPEREAKFLERRALQEQMFGTLKPLPREEYRQIYQSTGIDIDGRREMITHMIPCIEKAIKRFISFAKALPGFKELPIDDQIALIKASRFEVVFLNSYQCYRLDSGIIVPAINPNMTRDINQLCNFFNRDFVLERFHMAGCLQRLHLSVEEKAVLTGLVILAPDRIIELEAQDKISAAHDILVRSLVHLCEMNHPEDPVFMGKLVAVLTELRSLNEWSFKEMKQFHYHYDDIKWPPLFLDFMPEFSVNLDLILPEDGSLIPEINIDLGVLEEFADEENNNNDNTNTPTTSSQDEILL